ncbi:hypothetical protein F5X99DRAFT_430960 [Biscogniauxia marginata]|nr:hypothetical protein F5X99DRAFT_430960 [Biscogniauxia marginata]
MKHLTKLLAAYFVSLALGASDTRLQACSTNSPTPCRCPEGTECTESVTISIIGAAVADVEHLISDFYKTSWLGVVPFQTRGPDNRIGSIRTVHSATPIGIYDIDEKLTTYTVKSDGSFVQKLEQVQPSIPYSDGSGSFSGFWGTLEGISIFKDETLVRWSNYACETGHVRDFASFHEGALINATSILRAAGKIQNINAGPISAQAF